jgi:hypothetical protein
MKTEERFTRIAQAFDRMAVGFGQAVDNQRRFDVLLSTLAEFQIKLAEAHRETQQDARALECQWQDHLNMIRQR